MGIFYSLKLHTKNLQGRRCENKVVVIECDDWGSIRMPSREVYQRLIQASIPVDKSRFNSFDTLEDKQDLDHLFEVLLSTRDKNGHGAIMTAVTNVANPNFKLIKETDFSEYYFESFIDTYKKYNRDNDTFNMWKQGIKLGIFIPELHGREHLAVQFWMQKLREGNKAVLEAFNNGFVAVSLKGTIPILDQFRSEFYFSRPEQVEFLRASLSCGVDLFSHIFGNKPNVFVPSNSVFHPLFEEVLAKHGIKYLYVNTFNPTPGRNGKLRYKYYRNGGHSRFGLKYYTRNCAFEPTSSNYKGIDFTLKQIEIAFRWNKPANISTHRVNFAGGIDVRNRERGLEELKRLLHAIIRNWPDVEFRSSGDMLSSIYPTD